MPDYKILTQEKNGALNVIRKICTAEISIEEAISFISQARTELENTRKLINL